MVELNDIQIFEEEEDEDDDLKIMYKKMHERHHEELECTSSDSSDVNENSNSSLDSFK